MRFGPPAARWQPSGTQAKRTARAGLEGGLGAGLGCVTSADARSVRLDERLPGLSPAGHGSLCPPHYVI